MWIVTMILLDTSFLYAVNDERDKNHGAAVTVLSTFSEPLLLPAPVLSELCYLLDSRLGHRAMRRFVRGLAASDVRIASLSTEDIERTADLLDQYADNLLDFADTAIVAIAERENISQIATFDRRDFSIIRPRHVRFFELLP
jgi:predicted nucleic acid-binding protein